MNIRHKDIVIDGENPFANCQLGRERHSKILTKIVSTYANGFVLAVNGEWGSGKTTFVKMWEQQLKKEGYQTVYFNAWENDFTTNPLAALISELNPLLKPKNQNHFNNLIEKGAIITKNTLPQLLKVLASKYIDTEAIIGAIENTTKGVTEILENEIKDYTNKKENLKEFKKSLSTFVEVTKGDKPLIFIIDELDRCRPNYAVEVLEHIKHFFSVEGIVFILSIDKIQLGNAVRGVYGSDLIDANEYLRRFIDIEYSLPEPNIEDFCYYLFDYFDFGAFFYSERRKNYQGYKEERDNFIEFTTILFKKVHPTLRQQEKVFAHARLGLNLFRPNNCIYPELYVMLIFLKHFDNNLYSKIYQKKLDIKQLQSEFFKLIPEAMRKEDLGYFIKVEALLVIMYSNYAFGRLGAEIIERDHQSGAEKITIKSVLDPTNDSSRFAQAVKSYCSHIDFGIDSLMKKINLVEEMIQ